MEGATIPDSIVKLDSYSGALSTAPLHASIVALTGQAAYDQAFSATPYDTNHDGVLSTSELGTSVVGSMPAAEASIESIFYGTVIDALKSIADISMPTNAPVVTDSMVLDAVVQPGADMINVMGSSSGGSLLNAVLIA